MARTKQTGDWIAVLEAGYSLDGDDGAWLTGLLECVAREQWPDRFSAAFTFELGASGVVVGPALRRACEGTCRVAFWEGASRGFVAFG